MRSKPAPDLLKKMDLHLLEYYYKLELPAPLPFFNRQWHDFNKLLGPEQAIKLYQLMQDKKFACSAPFYYLMRELTYKLYLEEKNPSYAHCYFGFAPSTVEGHYKKYEKLNPAV